MSDLIDRQEAIDAVVSAMIDGADAELVEGIMEMLPPAQPERKTGRWKLIDPKTRGLCCVFICSECGEEIDCIGYDYCPNCGAKMEVEHDK